MGSGLTRQGRSTLEKALIQYFRGLADPPERIISNGKINAAVLARLLIKLYDREYQDEENLRRTLNNALRGTTKTAESLLSEIADACGMPNYESFIQKYHFGNFWEDSLHLLRSPHIDERLNGNVHRSEKSLDQTILVREFHDGSGAGFGVPIQNLALEVDHDAGFWRVPEHPIFDYELPLEEANNAKFGLVDILPDDTIDKINGKYKLVVRELDWEQAKKVRHAIANSRDKIKQFVSYNPAENKLPNIFAIHYIIELNDDNFLLKRRAESVEFLKNSWSFSGEEQISSDDLSRTPWKILEASACRAVYEELFPLRNSQNSPSENEYANHYREKYIKPSINRIDALGIIFDTQDYNYSVVLKIKLDMSVNDLWRHNVFLHNVRTLRPECEGTWFYASSDVILRAVRDNRQQISCLDFRRGNPKELEQSFGAVTSEKAFLDVTKSYPPEGKPDFDPARPYMHVSSLMRIYLCFKNR